MVPTGNKKKIALVFTGAVSLGSFEAGVAYELVKYIREQDTPDLEIDVIVGASAGALTGAVTALSLVFGTEPEMIRDSWLSVQLEDLLRLNPNDRSLLSSSKLEDLIKKFVRPPSPEAVKRSLSAAQAVNLVVVVTNLDGIKYRIHRTRDPGFSISAIGYEDAMKFEIGPRFSDWARLRSAVRASSAFPVAFEHKTIVRDTGEFRRALRHNFDGRGERSFHYSDGGIVNNQPLNKAIEMVGELPITDSNESFERIFLLVDPAPPIDGQAPPGDYGVFDVVSKALWTIPRNQTLYKDLLLLEKVNRRIRWKNSFVSTMADIWNSTGINPEKARPLEELCREVAVFKGEKMLGFDPAGYLRVEEDRIKNAYRNEMQKVSYPDYFTKYCFLLEHVADLRNKQEISVEMISPVSPEEELAGVIFGNFGGFLDTNFMKHDFAVGRIYARRWLRREEQLNRLAPCRKKAIPFTTKYRLFQKMLDNSVPLLVEEIAPRFFTLDKDLPKDVVGIFAFMKMLSVSFTKYVALKTLKWTRELIKPR